MIFVLAKNAPTLFVLLSESDVADKLRPGHTVTVVPEQLGGQTFNSVVLSLSKTDHDSMEMIRAADPEGAATAPFMNPPPANAARSEAACRTCKGTMSASSLFEGVCIVCWAKNAKALRRMLN